jgi:hypothetical protein
MISGHRNAFQLAIKVITAIAAKNAKELGTTTRQKAPRAAGCAGRLGCEFEAASGWRR